MPHLRTTSRAAALPAVFAALALAGCGDVDDAPAAPRLTYPDHCTIPFTASVRAGPHAGTAYDGLMTYKIAPSGSLTDAALLTNDGARIDVSGQLAGHTLTLALDAGAAGTLTGTGTTAIDPRTCLGEFGGTLTGAGGDAGDWAANASDSTSDASGALYLANPSGQTVLMKANLNVAATRYLGMTNLLGTADGPRLTAALDNVPTGLDVEDTRRLLYVTDLGSSLVRRVDMATGQVTTPVRLTNASAASQAAGFGALTSWRPRGVAADAGGAVYLTDASNFVVWRYNSNNGNMRLLAGSPGRSGARDGVGTAARFGALGTISLSDDQRLLNVVDLGNAVIRQIGLDGTVVTLGGIGGG